MYSLIYFGVLHGLGDEGYGLGSEPIIRIPRVCIPDLISCFLSFMCVVVKIDIVFHVFCFFLVLSIYPKYSG